jgi:hypothetical protein
MVFGNYTVTTSRRELEADTVLLALSIDVTPGVMFEAVSFWLDGLGSGVGSQPVRALVYDGLALRAVSDEVIVPDGSPLTLTTFRVQWTSGAAQVGLWAGGPSLAARCSITGEFGKRNTMPYGASPLDPRPMPSDDDDSPSAFIVTGVPVGVPEIPDEELAARGWYSAQRALAGQSLSGTRRAASVEWHHTSLDDHEGAFALVREGGPLEELVGDVLRVSYGTRAAYVYVIDASDEIDADLSLARRAFLQLANLADDERRMTLEVVAGAATG